MQILVTGAAGFIGSHLVKRLCLRGHEVFGVVLHEDQASPLSLRRLADSRFPNFHWMEETQNLAKLGHGPFDACVHLKGRSSVRASLNEPLAYEFTNCQSAVWLLRWMQYNRCRRVINASTVMVYGKDAPAPYKESLLGTIPASIYGASKLAAETMMNTWRALHGMETINLRLFSVYGPELRPDCVPHLIASAIQNEKDFTIFGDGSSVRDYVEVEDVLDAIEVAINVKWVNDFPYALNIGSGRGTTLLEMVAKIEQGLMKRARLVRKSAVAGELQSIVADVSAAERALGWKPGVDLDAGVARLTEWFRTRA